ncbi:MAG TPA: hypothetical protein VEM59_06440 [Acidimicrobiia bacterium]|nr:hypothetical protein [Acidimicrobiia bacterium]
MTQPIATSAPLTAPTRSEADRRMRRLLRLPEDAPRGSILGAQNAFSRSIAISAVRCLLTYVLIPLVGLGAGVSGRVAPAIGLVLGVVSMTAIFFAMRRLFAADHKWRWWYAGIGGTVFVFLLVGTGVDIAALLR